jgi:hypothetical protein
MCLKGAQEMRFESIVLECWFRVSVFVVELHVGNSFD